jgi:hypothetical protein
VLADTVTKTCPADVCLQTDTEVCTNIAHQHPYSVRSTTRCSLADPLLLPHIPSSNLGKVIICQKWDISFLHASATGSIHFISRCMSRCFQRDAKSSFHKKKRVALTPVWAILNIYIYRNVVHTDAVGSDTFMNGRLQAPYKTSV